MSKNKNIFNKVFSFLRWVGTYQTALVLFELGNKY